MSPRTVRSRRAEALTWFLAIVGGLAVLVLTASLGATIYRIHVGAALLIGVAQGGAVVLAVRWSWTGSALALIGFLAATLAATPDGSAPWPVQSTSLVAMCLVFALVGYRAHWIVGATGWAASNAVAVLAAANGPEHGVVPNNVVVATLVVYASVSLVVLGAAYFIRNIAEVRALLAREREVSAAEHARREMVEERARIARELHDVVAHGMSAIQVQAASARYRMPDLDDAAAAEFDELARTARDGMAEMRRLLDVLRAEESHAETAPQPGLADIGALVKQTGHDGEVRTVIDPAVETAEISPLVALSAYRIVQESLSNVVRHAPGADADVSITLARGALRVTVRSGTGRGTRPKAESGGHGLRGMRERAALLGGELTAGRMPDGGFLVDALLPLQNEGTP